MSGAEIVWTPYMKYRARLRGFDLAVIDRIVRYSAERYFDTATGRMIVVGPDSRRLVMIAYEGDGDTVTPVTVHVTTRRQISFRVKTGRFRSE